MHDKQERVSSAKATLTRRSSAGFLRGFWVKSLRIRGYGQGYGVSGYGGKNRAPVGAASHTQLSIITTQTHAPERCRAITEVTWALSSLKFIQQTPEGGHSGISFPFSEYLLNTAFAGEGVL